MSRKTLIAITVWKVLMDNHLKFPRVREFGFPRFPTIIKTNIETDI